MMKIDYQRAVQLRIPKMDAEPDRYFRPTVFICDEYQNFATVGGDNPTGDERFLSLSRQPKCIPIVATQSIASLKDALPNEGVKTLLQAFRTKIFLIHLRPGYRPLCIGAVRQGGQNEDQLHRLRVQLQRKCRLAKWPHLVQQRFRLCLQAVPETEGAAVRGESILRPEERSVGRRRLRRRQSASANLLLPEARLSTHRYDMV